MDFTCWLLRGLTSRWLRWWDVEDVINPIPRSSSVKEANIDSDRESFVWNRIRAGSRLPRHHTWWRRRPKLWSNSGNDWVSKQNTSTRGTPPQFVVVTWNVGRIEFAERIRIEPRSSWATLNQQWVDPMGFVWMTQLTLVYIQNLVSLMLILKSSRPIRRAIKIWSNCYEMSTVAKYLGCKASQYHEVSIKHS